MRFVHFLIPVLLSSTVYAADPNWGTTPTTTRDAIARLNDLDVHYHTAQVQLVSAVRDTPFRADALNLSAPSASIEALRKQAGVLAGQAKTMVKLQTEFVEIANQYSAELETAPARLNEIAARFNELKQPRQQSPAADGYENSANFFLSRSAQCVQRAKEVQETVALISENLTLMRDLADYFDRTERALAYVPDIFDARDKFTMQPAMTAYVKSFAEFQQALRGVDAKLSGKVPMGAPPTRTTTNPSSTVLSAVASSSPPSPASTRIAASNPWSAPASPSKVSPTVVARYAPFPQPPSLSAATSGSNPFGTESPRTLAPEDEDPYSDNTSSSPPRFVPKSVDDNPFSDEPSRAPKSAFRPRQPPVRVQPVSYQPTGTTPAVAETGTTDIALSLDCPDSRLLLRVYSTNVPVGVGSQFIVLLHDRVVGHAKIVALRWRMQTIAEWTVSLMDGTATPDCELRPVTNSVQSSPVFVARR